MLATHDMESGMTGHTSIGISRTPSQSHTQSYRDSYPVFHLSQSKKISLAISTSAIVESKHFIARFAGGRLCTNRT